MISTLLRESEVLIVPDGFGNRQLSPISSHEMIHFLTKKILLLPG
jgi:hypothetical protein